METTKLCKKCNVVKSTILFHKDKTKKDGIDCYCKECKCEIKRIQYNENKEKYIEKSRKYRENNPEKIKEINKNSKNKNKEKIKIYNKEYKQLNKEKLKEQKKEWILNNREKYLAYKRIKSKEYRNKKTKQERIRKYTNEAKERNRISKKNYKHRRRMQEKGGVTYIELKKILSEAKNCYWCNTKLKNLKPHIDHYVPLSKGGTHTLDNIVISCPTCNLTKNAKSPYDFAITKGRLF